jgi:hypothetical protein
MEYHVFFATQVMLADPTLSLKVPEDTPGVPQGFPVGTTVS